MSTLIAAIAVFSGLMFLYTMLGVAVKPETVNVGTVYVTGTVLMVAMILLVIVTW